METPADEPECSFLLEEKTGFMLFSSWTVKNYILKGRLLCYEEGESHYPVCNLGESVTVKLNPTGKNNRQFKFQTTCKDGTKYVFNAAHEEAREKCIIMFNFAARTGKWFYPFDELSYNDHPTMEVIGIPIKKPIYVPSSSKSSTGTSSAASASGPVITTTSADKKKLLRQRQDSPKETSLPANVSPINSHKHHVPFSPTDVAESPKKIASPVRDTSPVRDSSPVRATTPLQPATPPANSETGNSPFPPSRPKPTLRGQASSEVPSQTVEV